MASVPKSQRLVFFVENSLINQWLINVESYRIITVPLQTCWGVIDLVYLKLVVMLTCPDYESAEKMVTKYWWQKNGDKKLVTKYWWQMMMTNVGDRCWWLIILPSYLHQLQDGIVFLCKQQPVSAAIQVHILLDDLVEGQPNYHQLFRLCSLTIAACAWEQQFRNRRTCHPISQKVNQESIELYYFLIDL